MTTNLHDKMLAAIDALFSASDGDERDQAEEQLLDVRDEILKHKRAEQPAQHDPVAWGWAIMHSDGTTAYIRARVEDFFGAIQERESFTEEDVKQADREWAGLVPHSIVTLYTAPPAQQQEPVAWMHTNAIGHVYFRKNPQDKTLNPVPLYTSPPASKPWVGLTKDEVWDLWNAHTEPPFPEFFVDFKRSYEVIEAKLKEKNT